VSEKKLVPLVLDTLDLLESQLKNILISDQYSVAEKHTAISLIVKKIVFDKENKTLSFHYYIKDN